MNIYRPKHDWKYQKIKTFLAFYVIGREAGCSLGSIFVQKSWRHDIHPTYSCFVGDTGLTGCEGGHPDSDS
jgi:hypothetical protein